MSTISATTPSRAPFSPSTPAYNLGYSHNPARSVDRDPGSLHQSIRSQMVSNPSHPAHRHSALSGAISAHVSVTAEDHAREPFSDTNTSHTRQPPPHTLSHSTYLSPSPFPVSPAPFPTYVTSPPSSTGAPPPAPVPAIRHHNQPQPHHLDHHPHADSHHPSGKCVPALPVIATAHGTHNAQPDTRAELHAPLSAQHPHTHEHRYQQEPQPPSWMPAPLAPSWLPLSPPADQYTHTPAHMQVWANAHPHQLRYPDHYVPPQHAPPQPWAPVAAPALPGPPPGPPYPYTHAAAQGHPAAIQGVYTAVNGHYAATQSTYAAPNARYTATEDQYSAAAAAAAYPATPHRLIDSGEHGDTRAPAAWSRAGPDMSLSLAMEQRALTVATNTMRNTAGAADSLAAVDAVLAAARAGAGGGQRCPSTAGGCSSDGAGAGAVGCAEAEEEEAGQDAGVSTPPAPRRTARPRVTASAQVPRVASLVGNMAATGARGMAASGLGSALPRATHRATPRAPTPRGPGPQPHTPAGAHATAAAYTSAVMSTTARSASPARTRARTLTRARAASSARGSTLAPGPGASTPLGSADPTATANTTTNTLSDPADTPARASPPSYLRTTAASRAWRQHRHEADARDMRVRDKQTRLGQTATPHAGAHAGDRAGAGRPPAALPPSGRSRSRSPAEWKKTPELFGGPESGFSQYSCPISGSAATHPGPHPLLSLPALPPPPTAPTFPLHALTVSVPTDAGLFQLRLPAGEDARTHLRQFCVNYGLAAADEAVVAAGVVESLHAQYAARYAEAQDKRAQAVAAWRARRERWLRAGGDPRECPDVDAGADADAGTVSRAYGVHDAGELMCEPIPDAEVAYVAGVPVRVTAHSAHTGAAARDCTTTRAPTRGMSAPRVRNMHLQKTRYSGRSGSRSRSRSRSASQAASRGPAAPRAAEPPAVAESRPWSAVYRRPAARTRTQPAAPGSAGAVGIPSSARALQQLRITPVLPVAPTDAHNVFAPVAETADAATAATTATAAAGTGAGAQPAGHSLSGVKLAASGDDCREAMAEREHSVGRLPSLPLPQHAGDIDDGEHDIGGVHDDPHADGRPVSDCASVASRSTPAHSHAHSHAAPASVSVIGRAHVLTQPSLALPASPPRRAPADLHHTAAHAEGQAAWPLVPVSTNGADMATSTSLASAASASVRGLSEVEAPRDPVLCVAERTLAYRQASEANKRLLAAAQEEQRVKLRNKTSVLPRSARLVHKQRAAVAAALAAVKVERETETARAVLDAQLDLLGKGDVDAASTVRVVHSDPEQVHPTQPTLVDDPGARLYLDALQRQWHLQVRRTEQRQQRQAAEDALVANMRPVIPARNRRVQAKAMGAARNMDVFSRLQLAAELIAANRQARQAARKQEEEAAVKDCFQPTTCARSRRIVARLAQSHDDHSQTMWSSFHERLYKDHFDRQRRHGQRRQREALRLPFAPALDARSRRIVAGQDEEVGRYKAALWGQVALLKQVVSSARLTPGPRKGTASGRKTTSKSVDASQRSAGASQPSAEGSEASWPGAENGEIPANEFTSQIPESFFRTPSGQAYGERLCMLLREHVQAVLQRLEQERRRLGVSVDMFLARCEAYTRLEPGDEVSALVMRQRELLSQLATVEQALELAAAEPNTPVAGATARASSSSSTTATGAAVKVSVRGGRTPAPTPVSGRSRAPTPLSQTRTAAPAASPTPPVPGPSPSASALGPAALAAQPPQAKLRLIKAALHVAERQNGRASKPSDTPDSTACRGDVVKEDAAAAPELDTAALLALAPPSVPLPSAGIASTRRLRVLRDAAVDAVAEQHLGVLEGRRRAQEERRRRQRYVAAHGHEHGGLGPLYPGAAGTREGEATSARGPAGGSCRAPQPTASPSTSTSSSSSVASSSAGALCSSTSPAAAPPVPFQRTQHRAASRARLTHAATAGLHAAASTDASATTPRAEGDLSSASTATNAPAQAVTRFPEVYLRALSGRLRHLCGLLDADNDGFVDCSAYTLLPSLAPHDAALVRGCLLAVAADIKAHWLAEHAHTLKRAQSGRADPEVASCLSSHDTAHAYDHGAEPQLGQASPHAACPGEVAAAVDLWREGCLARSDTRLGTGPSSYSAAAPPAASTAAKGVFARGAAAPRRGWLARWESWRLSKAQFARTLQEYVRRCEREAAAEDARARAAPAVSAESAMGAAVAHTDEVTEAAAAGDAQPRLVSQRGAATSSHAHSSSPAPASVATEDYWAQQAAFAATAAGASAGEFAAVLPHAPAFRPLHGVAPAHPAPGRSPVEVSAVPLGYAHLYAQQQHHNHHTHPHEHGQPHNGVPSSVPRSHWHHPMVSAALPLPPPPQSAPASRRPSHCGALPTQPPTGPYALPPQQHASLPQPLQTHHLQQLSLPQHARQLQQPLPPGPPQQHQQYQPQYPQQNQQQYLHSQPQHQPHSQQPHSQPPPGGPFPTSAAAEVHGDYVYGPGVAGDDADGAAAYARYAGL